MRRAVLLLNSYTRWSLGELLEMELEELVAWLEEIPQVYRRR